MKRVLEPELMTDHDQAQAYPAADFAAVNQSFVDRFRARFPDFEGGHLVDLGCGPADIPIRFCRALPSVTVTAVDGSEAMLGPGRAAVAAAGLESRVRLVCARLPGSVARAREIVEAYSGGEPEVLKRDFFHSLCAAFTLAEVEAQLPAVGLDDLRCEMISDRHWAVSGKLRHAPISRR